MKTKYIFWILAGLMVCAVYSISQGAGKFYYGTYGGEPERDFLPMRDSLKFNIVYDHVYPSGPYNIAYYRAASLRAIVANDTSENSPSKWASKSHYTLWEAEGYPGSYFGFDYKGKGVEVWDDSASGHKARLFRPLKDKRDTVQRGPNYNQDFLYNPNDTIKYTAEFQLRSPKFLPDSLFPDKGGGTPVDTVCILKVVSKDTLANDTILAQRVVYASEFKSWFRYEPFYVQYNATKNPIEFQIYWLGKRPLYIDYVKVYDNNGKELMRGDRNAQIVDYVSQSWVHTTLPNGDTVVYRWYLVDEPEYIDLFQPSRYIDSLLRVVSSERVGFQAFNKFWRDTLQHEYFVRQNPKEYHVDIYPTGWWGPDSSGVHFQAGVSELTQHLNDVKQEALNRGKDLWVTIQGHYYGDRVNGPNDCLCSTFYADTSIVLPPDIGWYCYHLKRPPTGNEVRLQTFLAMCYGATSILNYMYDSWMSTNPQTGARQLRLGLHNTIKARPTERWHEIKNFTGPRVEKLGPILDSLTWQGACFHDSVGSFVLRNSQPSYIDSIVGWMPDSTYVQVGFFEHYDTSYFMLVNRKTLESQEENLTIYFDPAQLSDSPIWYATDQYWHDTITVPLSNGAMRLAIHLAPGEGKLFRLQPHTFSSHVIRVPQDSSCIQCAIDGAQNNDTVLVVPGTYPEHIDFNGKNIVVGSYYILLGESHYIGETKISPPAFPLIDKASVVTFESNEDSNSVLIGFTVRNGRGNALQKMLSNCLEGERYGGGIYCAASPVIRNNIIEANHAEGELVCGYGGGIFCEGGNPTILFNHIRSNESNYGGGICCWSSSAKIINNLIVSNSASYIEEGLEGSMPRDTSLDDGGYGGGIECRRNSSVLIINNTIDDNYAYIYGAGIDIGANSSAYIINSIISNSRQMEGIYIHSGCDTVKISYCDFWSNDDGDFDGVMIPGLGNISWGTNRNGTPCDSFYNIFHDPMFSEGYSLGDSSDCIDAGDNNVPGLPTTDFNGNARIVDFVDMGALEYQGGSSPVGGAKLAGASSAGGDRSSMDPPKAFELSQNYPNPLNPSTTIAFTVSPDQSLYHITLRIYNISGQIVKTLVDEDKTPGTYSVTWDGKNNSGEEVASGIYFYQLKSENFKETKRMVLIK